MSKFFDKINGKRVVLDNETTRSCFKKNYNKSIKLLKEAIFELHGKVDKKRNNIIECQAYTWYIESPTYFISMNHSDNQITFMAGKSDYVSHEMEITIGDESDGSEVTVKSVLEEFLIFERDWWSEKDLYGEHAN